MRPDGTLDGFRSLGDGRCGRFYHIRYWRAARDALSSPDGTLLYDTPELRQVERKTQEWADGVRARVERYAAIYDAEGFVPTPRRRARQR